MCDCGRRRALNGCASTAWCGAEKHGYTRASVRATCAFPKRCVLLIMSLMSFLLPHFTMFCDFVSVFYHIMARYHETPTRSAAKTLDYRQKYSLYQPVHGKSHRKASVSKHGDKGQRERDALRASAEAVGGSGRRRGTMRSKEHDDEEALLQRAIEESKREIEARAAARKNGKRARDESEE